MNQVDNIISQLEKQRVAIEKALSALREVAGAGGAVSGAKRVGRPPAATKTAAPAAKPKRRKLSAAGRKAIIAAAKKRWAEHRAAKAGEASGKGKK